MINIFLNDFKRNLEFHIFDIFLFNNKEMTQKDRYEILNKLITKNYKYVKLVPTKIVHSREELDNLVSARSTTKANSTHGSLGGTS